MQKTNGSHVIGQHDEVIAGSIGFVSKPKCKSWYFLNINEINIKKININNDPNIMRINSFNVLGKDTNPNLDLNPYQALWFGDLLSQIIS